MSNKRESDLLNIRPQVNTALINSHTSESEQFQNSTLRPIIKFQHCLVIWLMRRYIEKTNKKFFEESVEKRILFVEHALDKNIALRNQYIGIVVGHFTNKDTENYEVTPQEYNKRILQMIRQRLISSLDKLEH